MKKRIIKKNKSRHYWKIAAITASSILAISVPIAAVTATGLTLTNSSTTDTPILPPDDLPGGDDNNNQGGGTEQPGGGSDDQTPEQPSEPGDDSEPNVPGDGNHDNDIEKVVTPQLNTSLELTTSLDKLFTGNVNGINDNIEQLIKNEQKEQLISNYSEFSEKQKESLNFNIDANITSNDWGENDYSIWSVIEDTSKVVFANHNENSISISSPDALHSKLNEQNGDVTNITKLMRSIVQNSQTKNFSLVEESNLGLDEQFLHINVKENTPTYSAASQKLYDLAIPLNALDLQVTTNLTVTGNNVKQTTQEVNLKYDIGLSTETIQINKEIKLNKYEQYVTTENVMKTLEFYDPSSNVLDQDKISKYFDYYNVTFSNPKIILTNPNNELGSVNYDGLYSIKFVCTPKPNFKWNDGSTESKDVIFKNVKVILCQSLWGGSLNSITTYTLPKKFTTFEDGPLNEYFNEKGSRDKVENDLNKIILSDKNTFRNLRIKLIYQDRTENWVANKKLRAQLVPADGFDYHNQTPESAKLFITLRNPE